MSNNNNVDKLKKLEEFMAKYTAGHYEEVIADKELVAEYDAKIMRSQIEHEKRLAENDAKNKAHKKFMAEHKEFMAKRAAEKKAHEEFMAEHKEFMANCAAKKKYVAKIISNTWQRIISHMEDEWRNMMINMKMFGRM